MFFELEFRQGLGLDIQYIEEQLESVIAVDEDANEEPGLLRFQGIRILLPFIQIRWGEAEIHTKE